MTRVHENDARQEDRITPEITAYIRNLSPQQQVDVAAVLAHLAPTPEAERVVVGTACPAWCTNDHAKLVMEIAAQFTLDVQAERNRINELSAALPVDIVDSLAWHEHLVIENEYVKATIEDGPDDELVVGVVIGNSEFTISAAAAREVGRQLDWAADVLGEITDAA